MTRSGADDSGDDIPQVERPAALATVQAAATAAGKGIAGVALVRGVAGMGKTTLLNRARAEFEHRDGHVLFAAAGRAKSFNATVRELFAPLGLTGPASASPLVAGADSGGLAALIGSGPDLGAGESAAFPVLHGLYRLAVNVMAEGPLTIMLDDAHDCAPLVLCWVDFLLRRAAHQPLLVVLAHDPDVTGPAREPLNTVSGRACVTKIELGPLSRAEVAGLVTATLRAEPEPPFTQLCLDLFGGNPLALRTLLRELRAAGVRPDGPGTGRAAEIGVRAMAGAMPALLDRLPDSVRRVAAGMAVLGSTEPRMVAALLELSPLTVTAAADVLRRHALLPTRRLELDLEQVRAAVLGDLPPGELDALRLRGALLLHDNGRSPEEIAGLLVHLPELSEPWMWCVLRDAAADARRRGDPQTGARFLNRALAVVPGHADTLVELAVTLSDTDPEAAVSHFLAAIERTGDLRGRAGLVIRFGVLSLKVRRVTAAFRLLCDVLDALDRNPAVLPGADDNLRRQVQAVMLTVGLHSQQDVRETLRRARTIVVPSGDTPAGRLVRGALAGTAMVDGGSGREVADHARAALSGRLVVDDGPPVIAAKLLHHAGQPEEALAALDRIVADTRRAGIAWAHCNALAIRASVAAGMGRPAEAAIDIQAAMTLAHDENWVTPRIVFASLLVNRGEPGRAEAILDGISLPNFVWEHHEMLMVRAAAALTRGDAEGALALLLRCGRSMADGGINSAMLNRWWFGAVDLLTELGRWSDAVALLDAQEEAIARWGTPESTGLGLIARGVVTGGPRRKGLLAEGVEVLAASPARLSQLAGELAAGRALLRAGDGVGARRYLHHAVELAVRCDCPGPAARMREQLVAAGGRMRKRGGATAGLLTAAERRVVERAAAGVTNRQIAEALFVTLRTVETHLSSVYRKLGVTSRADIAAALRELSATERGIGAAAIAGGLGPELVSDGRM